MPRLVDLDASFRTWLPRALGKCDAFPAAQGILFQCPACAGPDGSGHYVLVWFADRGVPSEAEPKPRWHASGTGLDDLTLTPSINLDVPGPNGEPAIGCRWHGWVRGGVVK